MTTDDQTAENESTYPRPAYAWYVVVLMMCFYVLSFMDRQIIAVMLDPIKDDLALTDFQIAMVHGWGFGLFYAVVGIFIYQVCLLDQLLVATHKFLDHFH